MTGEPTPSLPKSERSTPVGGVGPETASSSRPPWAMEGRRLGRYRLGPSLGRGGMGEVFEAWDTLLNRVVAVKTLNTPNPVAIIRFMKEAQLQARVSHPNVCRIFDVDASDNVPFIAMQLVRGPSLHAAAPGLSQHQAVEILATVAQAMHAAHRVNLIHRDLKPSNILLEPAPAGGWTPYVADFGLAKDLEEEGLTQTQGVLGTPSFMAPEQRAGEGGRVGPSTDVYALGATLCSVLNLDRRGRSRELTLPARGAPPPREGPAWGSVPRDLRTILRRCLEERPQDRYPTAGALAEDFRRFLDGEPLLAEHHGWLRKAGRFLSRRPALSSSLAISLVLGMGFGLWSIHLSAAGKRRTVLALRFAQDAKDLENSIGLARLHPPHDMRPLLATMNEGLERIQKDIRHLGPEARGPGNFALGRGFLAMRSLEPALRVLEDAWNSGYRNPEVAYALCRTHCEIYIRMLDLEQFGDVPPHPETAALHLEAAKDFYALSAGAAWEPPGLCRARILIFEGRPAEALVEAEALLASNPWFYEAKVEESYAHAALGLECQRRGDAAGAMERFRRAEAAALEAQAIGRSEVNCYLASVHWRLYLLQDAGVPPARALELWQEAEALLDTTLVIRPWGPRGISGKVHAILGRARCLKALGRDPRPELARAEAFLRRAQPTPAFRWLIPANEDLIRRTREELAGLS